MSGACPTTPFPSKINLRSRTRNFSSSAMSGKKYSRAFGVQLWEIDAIYPPMSRADFDAIYAFALAQSGTYGTFTFAAHDRRSPRGTASGSPYGAPVISGAGQTGSSINITGLPASTTGYLLPGDLVLLPGATKVYMNTTSVDSDGSGDATMTLNANVVSSPTNGAAITVLNVPFTVSLTEDIQELSTDHPNIYQFAMKMVEAL